MQDGYVLQFDACFESTSRCAASLKFGVWFVRRIWLHLLTVFDLHRCLVIGLFAFEGVGVLGGVRRVVAG